MARPIYDFPFSLVNVDRVGECERLSAPIELCWQISRGGLCAPMLSLDD